MAAILDFRSCDIREHFYVHKLIDHTPKHRIRHQDHLSRLDDTKVMLVFSISAILGGGHIEYGPKSAFPIFPTRDPD